MALNKIAWIGRFTGPKGELAAQIVREVVPQFPHCQFTFVGGATTLEIPASEKGHVRIISEFITDIRGEINKHDLIIGAGRVAMEAMRCGVPVIAVGERRYVGLINSSTIELAKQTNFGDSDWQSDFNLPTLIADLKKIIGGEQPIDTTQYNEFLHDYAAEYVHQQVLEVYAQARLERYLQNFAELPVLMYHRVVEQSLQDSRYNLVEDSPFCLVQAVENLPLRKDRRLWRVDVLGRLLVAAEDTTAERDHAPLLVADGKHETAAEAVVVAICLLLADDEAALLDKGQFEILALRPVHRVVPGFGREPETEELHGFFRNPALGEVVPRDLAGGVVGEGGLPALADLFVHQQQGVLEGAGFTLAGLAL